MPPHNPPEGDRNVTGRPANARTLFDHTVRMNLVGRMGTGGYRLGVDFGTSSTVALLAGPDGRERQLLFGETPVMPSAVYLDPDGVLLVGADALRASRARPEFFEP